MTEKRSEGRGNISDTEAFMEFEGNFCDKCGRHFGWHGENGECPPRKDEFMLGVKKAVAEMPKDEEGQPKWLKS
jgi:hypothetical protein